MDKFVFSQTHLEVLRHNLSLLNNSADVESMVCRLSEYADRYLKSKRLQLGPKTIRSASSEVVAASKVLLKALKRGRQGD